MKTMEVWLKSVAISLNSLAEAIQTIAKTVDDMSKTQVSEPSTTAKKETRKTTKPTPKTKSKPVTQKAKKKPRPKGKMTVPATEKVLRVIKQSKKGMDNKTIAEKSGLGRKQVINALSQLKKTGKIKSVKRGVHRAI
jgi:predicted Rossmann fold nucleotide-binding protein DprA/Smf involved in DNA uptake